MDPQQPQTPPTPPTPPTPAPVSTPVSPVANTLGKFTKKQLILAAGAFAGLVLVIVLAVTISTAVFGISKDDYTKAIDTFESVVKKGSNSTQSLGTVEYLSTMTTQTKAENDVEDAKTSLAEYKTANATLKGLKALRDGDVKVKYDAYSEKYDSYVALADDYLASVEKVYPVFIDCTDVKTSISLSSTDLGSYRAEVNACVKALDGIGTISNKDLKELTAQMSKVYGELSKYVTEYMTLGTPDKYGSADYARAREIREATYDLTYSAAQTDATSNIIKHSDAVRPSDAANELADLLIKKRFNK